MAAQAVVGLDEDRDRRHAIRQHHLADGAGAPHRARHLHYHGETLGSGNAPALGSQVDLFHGRFEHLPIAGIPARGQRLRIDLGSQAQGREGHLFDHASRGVQRLRLQQQIGFDIRTEAIAVAQLVHGLDGDQPAFAPRHPVQRGFRADPVVLGQIGGIAQQQTRKTVAAATLDQHRLALGDQALHIFVMAQIFARLAVQDFQALALAGAVQHMDQTGGLDGLALLIHENARVVLLAGRLLDARQQLHHILGRGGGRDVGRASGFVGSEKCSEQRGGEPGGPMSRPGSGAAQGRPACRKHQGHQRPAPASKDTWRTALGPAICRCASR